MAGFLKKAGMVRRAASLLMGLLLLTMDTTAVLAADMALPDLERTGSIELTLTDVEGKTVSGGSVTLYEVAELHLDGGSMAYEYTEAFADCTAILDVTDLTLAEALADYMDQHPAEGKEKDIGEDGKISFTDLKPGLYMLVQTAESDSSEKFNSFIVSIPTEFNGEWTYTVDAAPKVASVTPEKTEPPTEGNTEPPTEGNTEPSTEGSSESPTEEGTELSTEGDTEPSTEGSTESSTGKSTEPESETASKVVSTTNSNNTNAPGSSNDTTAAATTTLPQTGQLNWPVPVLTVGGILLFLIGWYLKHSEEKREKHAS